MTQQTIPDRTAATILARYAAGKTLAHIGETLPEPRTAQTVRAIVFAGGVQPRMAPPAKSKNAMHPLTDADRANVLRTASTFKTRRVRQTARSLGFHEEVVRQVLAHWTLVDA